MHIKEIFQTLNKFFFLFFILMINTIETRSFEFNLIAKLWDFVDKQSQ